MSVHVHLGEFDMGRLPVNWYPFEVDTGHFNVEECYIGKNVLVGYVACHPAPSDEARPWRAYRRVGRGGPLTFTPRQEEENPLGVRIGGRGKQRVDRSSKEKVSRGQFPTKEEARRALVRAVFHFYRTGDLAELLQGQVP